jgi:NAD(P)H-hydrate epimerase
MRLLTSEEMRIADAHAIENIGIPSIVLMENAGIKTLFTLERILGGLKGKRFCIICGKGNNGGDGLVIARHLANNQVPVYVFILAEPDNLSKDARVNFDILAKMGIDPVIVKDDEDVNRMRIALEFSDCLIDCVFGTGFSGEISGRVNSVIEAMNDSRAVKVSVDLPKLGLFVFPGKKAAGEVWVADIGIPEPSFAEAATKNFLITRQLAETLIPERDPQMHKGNAGKVLILAGSSQYQGAGIMASYGALRSGAGIVNLGLPDCLRGDLCCQILPETILTWFKSEDGGFSLDQETICAYNGRFRSLLAGPGWGRGESVGKALSILLDHWHGHLILDADALNVIEDPTILRRARQIPVITPHLGEMARLLGKTIDEVAENTVELARGFATENRLILVLKSAVTIIADHTGRVFVASNPNSGLARGGTGDLLAGLIAGLAATVISPLNASVVGVYLLAIAGEAAVSDLGTDAVTVSEIASYIPRAFRALRGEITSASGKS